MTTAPSLGDELPRPTECIAPVVLGEWFLTAAERGNPDTRLITRHPGSQHWATGNDVGNPVEVGPPHHENRHLGAEIEEAGGQCLLDMRVRVLGSHHQKLVVLRHQARPEDDIAFLGGIDVCHGRRDDARPGVDPQSEPLAKAYGSRPPLHDIQLAVRGPAVGDAEAVFRERWDDRAALSRNPVHLLGELIHREQRRARPLP